MTTYTINPALQPGTDDWTDPSFWQQGKVPDDPSAQVFLTLATGSGGDIVSVASGQSISIGSLAVQSCQLLVSGSLTSVGKITGESGIQLAGGTLTAQVMQVGYLHGAGQVIVSGPIYNDGAIESDSSTLDIKAAYFDNQGILQANDGSTLIVETGSASGFVNDEYGTLVGGSYSAGNGGNLDLKTPGLIHSISAQLILSGDDTAVIASYDPSYGRYVPFQSSVTLITPSGSLGLESGTYDAAGSLTVEGPVNLLGASHLSAAVILYLTSEAQVDIEYSSAVQSVTARQIVDDGQIYVAGGAAKLDAAIHGDGSIVVVGATVELTKSVSGVSLFFSGEGGAAILDAPGQFSAYIQGFKAGDSVLLPSVARSSVTGFSYAPGILTVHEGGTVLHFAFTGDYMAADFSLEAAPGGTGTALIGVTPGAV